ncbi:MAG: hypothetical protein JSV25_15200 [Spirochaetota bacterium]|nr:MAG: hypothetical protein JSV25_15200 [Spirochaetota bacterium]
MIPLIFKMRIERTNEKPFRLFIPLFLVWLVIIPLLIVLSPFILLCALILRKSELRKLFLYFYQILFSSLIALSGLSVAFEKGEKKFLLKFI